MHTTKVSTNLRIWTGTIACAIGQAHRSQALHGVHSKLGSCTSPELNLTLTSLRKGEYAAKYHDFFLVCSLGLNVSTLIPD